MSRRGWLLGGGAVGVAAVVTAVAVHAAVDDSADPPDGPVITAPATSDGASAQCFGPLQLDRGCLTLGPDVAVWPHGTTWDADSRTVRTPQGDWVVGAPVELAGGEVPITGVVLPAASQRAVERCRAALGASHAWIVAPF